MGEELRKVDYAEATVHGIKVKCLRLDRYAKENGLDNTFSLELVDRFLRDRYYYPYPPGEKLPEQTQDIAAQMRKLINYKLYSTGFYSKQPIFPDYPAIFKAETEKFLSHLEKVNIQRPLNTAPPNASANLLDFWTVKVHASYRL